MGVSAFKSLLCILFHLQISNNKNTTCPVLCFQTALCCEVKGQQQYLTQTLFGFLNVHSRGNSLNLFFFLHFCLKPRGCNLQI